MSVQKRLIEFFQENQEFLCISVLEKEYKVLDKIEVKHLVCGTSFFVMIDRFLNKGTRCPNKECRIARTKQTHLKKYGYECIFSKGSGFRKEKEKIDRKEEIIQLCGEEYSIKETNNSFFQSDKIILIHNICNKEYNVKVSSFLRGSRCSNPKCLMERFKKTCIDRYGVENVLQMQSIKDKAKLTCVKKYGFENVSQNKQIQDKKSVNSLNKAYNSLQDKFPLLETCFPQEEYSGVHDKRYRFRCKECGYEFDRTIHCNIPVCRKCNPLLRGTSKSEIEVYDFIISNVGSIINSNIRSVISPKEIDIYSEQHRVGVEFNGLYWHSEEFVDKLYHFEKSKLAREAGIKLFHIFSDEWEQKQDIVKSMLSHAFGVTQRKLFARKCSIAEVSTRDAKHFFESTHISGGGLSKSAFGLFYDGQLVSCLSLGIPIKNKRYSNCIEIVRFANQLNTHVVGGFSKLLTAAKRWSLENGFENILSYADLRFGDGNVYRKNGFEYLGDTEVNYWYTDGLNRYSRQSFRARDGKTERQISEEASVFKIYGCGHAIFIKKIA